VPDDQQAEVKRAIKQLVKQGKLAYGSNHLVSRPQGAQNEVLGRFRRAMSGYGFVRPEGVARSAGRTEDIFIPAAKTGDAANGDLVRVRIQRRRKGDGPTRTGGEIVEIVERARS